jgi:hypothetical protein
MCFSIPELVFWHIPSIAYTQAGPKANQPIDAPCVGSINDEGIAPQETEWGIMNVLTSRNSVKVLRINTLLLFVFNNACRSYPFQPFFRLSCFGLNSKIFAL